MRMRMSMRMQRGGKDEGSRPKGLKLAMVDGRGGVALSRVTPGWVAFASRLGSSGRCASLAAPTRAAPPKCEQIANRHSHRARFESPVAHHSAPTSSSPSSQTQGFAPIVHAIHPGRGKCGEQVQLHRRKVQGARRITFRSRARPAACWGCRCGSGRCVGSWGRSSGLRRRGSERGIVERIFGKVKVKASAVCSIDRSRARSSQRCILTSSSTW